MEKLGDFDAIEDKIDRRCSHKSGSAMSLVSVSARTEKHVHPIKRDPTSCSTIVMSEFEKGQISEGDGVDNGGDD